MTAAVTNTKSAGGIFTNVAQSLGFTGTAGRTMIVAVWGEGADTMTGLTDSASNTYVEDVNNAIFGNGRRFYRSTAFTGAPTSITIQAPTSYQAYYAAWEVTGLAASSVLDVTAASSSAGTSHAVAFTTATNNCIAFGLTGYSGDPGTTTATGSTVLVTHTEYARDALYILDCGTAGAKSITYDTTLSITGFNLVAAYKILAGATVSTITGTTAAEGSAVVFTATMSGTGGLTSAYSFSGSATGGGVDYTSTLTDGMCAVTGGSGSVTVSGSNIIVDSTVTAFTVTVPTTTDTIDEGASETIRLVIGGVTASSGTITDDDPVPAWSVSNAATVTAGSPAIFTISADRASALTQNLTLGFIDGTRVGGTGYDNTIQNSDITPGTVTISAGVLTIPAGVTSFTVSVGTV